MKRLTLILTGALLVFGTPAWLAAAPAPDGGQRPPAGRHYSSRDVLGPRDGSGLAVANAVVDLMTGVLYPPAAIRPASARAAEKTVEAPVVVQSETPVIVGGELEVLSQPVPVMVPPPPPVASPR